MKIPKFISIQGSYSKLELALFIGKSKISYIHEDNIKASSLLIPYIKQMLEKTNLKISDLDFICIDQGPGAFTSLRVTISTVNGIAFANQIPLIGIDGLDALSIEATRNVMLKNKSLKIGVTIPLLNAYNNEVFFCISKSSSTQSSIQQKQNRQLHTTNNTNHNYKKIDLLLSELKTNFKDQKILFTGNGAQLHKELIKQTFQDNAFIYKKDVCSENQIAKMALEKWELIKNSKSFEYKLYPLYLKSQNFATRPIKK